MRILLNMDASAFEPMTNLYWLYYLSRVLLKFGDRKLGKNDANRDKMAGDKPFGNELGSS